MLTREQKQQLNELSYSQIFFSEHNGIPLDNVHREPVSIPDFTELQEYAFQTIRGLGFTSINLVMPWRANLIVRLFYKRHYPYDCLEMHNLYGYLCYTRSGLSWVTDSNTEFNQNYIGIFVSYILWLNSGLIPFAIRIIVWRLLGYVMRATLAVALIFLSANSSEE